MFQGIYIWTIPWKLACTMQPLVPLKCNNRSYLIPEHTICRSPFFPINGAIHMCCLDSYCSPTNGIAGNRNKKHKYRPPELNTQQTQRQMPHDNHLTILAPGSIQHHHRVFVSGPFSHGCQLVLCKCLYSTLLPQVTCCSLLSSLLSSRLHNVARMETALLPCKLKTQMLLTGAP